MWNPQGPAAGRSARRSGPCKPMMLTWVTFYIISSREPPPFWKNSSDIKIFGISEFWESWTQSKNDDFWQKKSQKYFPKIPIKFLRKNFHFLNLKSPSPSNDRVITIKIHWKNFWKISSKFFLSELFARILYTSDINHIKTFWPIPQNLCWPIRKEIFIRLGRRQWNSASRTAVQV